jgi:hypothetical protein
MFDAAKGLTLMVGLAVLGCGGGQKQEESIPPSAPAAQESAGGGDLLAAEQAAYEKAKPVFEKYCVKCHTSSGKKSKKETLEHFSMDGYPFGGHHAPELGQVIPVVLGATGKEAEMPQDDPGAVKGDELQAILEWAAAFEKSHAAGLHQDGGEHHH